MIAEADASIPKTFLGVLPLQSITLEEHITDDTWKVLAHYESLGIDTAAGGEESSFSFDTGGGRHRLTQSLGTTSYAPPAVPPDPALTPPDMGGAIGYDGEHIQGVDITVPVYNFTETHYLPVATVTTGYKTTLADLTGTVNDGAFRGFPAGEVLFLGASGSRRNEEKWAITFRFARQKNVTGLTVGTIVAIDKLGWQYLWVRYKDDVKDDRKVRIPAFVYVEDVYESASFGGLGI